MHRYKMLCLSHRRPIPAIFNQQKSWFLSVKNSISELKNKCIEIDAVVIYGIHSASFLCDGFGFLSVAVCRFMGQNQVILRPQ